MLDEALPRGARRTRQRVRTALMNRPLTRAWARGLWWRLPGHPDPPVPLAVCAIFRNEASYLAEWVAFHRLMGVEEFYLYNNGSTDDWRSVLKQHIATGIVHVMHWPARRAPQLAAYRHCLAHRRKRPRWIAFIDIDEFLFSPTGRRLPEVLSAFGRQAGVVVAWRVFGTSGWGEQPDGLVTESYLRRAANAHFLSHYGKAVVDPRRTVSYVTTPHHFRHYHQTIPWRSELAVDEQGRPCSDRCTSANLLRINHYYSKSEAEAIARFDRGTLCTDYPLRQRLDPRLNDVHDDAILRFLPDLREHLGVVRAPEKHCDFEVSDTRDAAPVGGTVTVGSP
jgi:hypothetical protein